jgi:hypothetical protein
MEMKKVGVKVGVETSSTARKEASAASTWVNPYAHERYMASSDEDREHQSRNQSMDQLRSMAMRQGLTPRFM